MSKGNRVTKRKQSIVQTWNIHKNYIPFTFDLLTPSYHHSMCQKKWGHRVETVQSLKTKYDPDFWPKNQQMSIWGHPLYMSEVSSLYAKRKWSYQAKTVKKKCKKFKVQIWPWFLTYWPQIERGPSQAMVNTSAKYHYCMPKINGWCGMPTEDAYSSGHLVLSPLWDLQVF